MKTFSAFALVLLVSGCGGLPAEPVDPSYPFRASVETSNPSRPNVSNILATRDEAENWILDQVSQLDTWAADGQNRTETAAEQLASWQGEFINFAFTAPMDLTVVFTIEEQDPRPL